MKRKSLLFLMLMAMLAPLAMKAQTTLLTEGFENMTTFSTSYSTTDWYAYNAGYGNNWDIRKQGDTNYDSWPAYNGIHVAHVHYNTTNAANCYLVSTPFTVSANMTELSVSLYERTGGYDEIFEVFFVKASDVTNLAGVTSATHYDAVAAATYNNTAYAQVSGSVTSSALAGQSVRVVFHCTSAADQYFLNVDDITVTETTSGGGTPSYCTPSFGSNSDCIINFTLGSINNSTASSSTYGYGNYTSQSTDLTIGSTVTASLTSGAGTGTHAAAVWIDFDDNGTFDSSDERVGTQSNIGASSTVNISLSIPSNAALGSHRLRVIYQYNVNATDINPCAEATYGEGEDYTVVITAATPTYSVNTASNVTNGTIEYSINGGVNWFSSLTDVAAGETVVISVQPETGYELSGMPTVTPTCNVTGSGNLYSFVMPESDVTVNATFNCTTPADPTFSVAGGNYTTVQNVTITCATAGATIYYTTDGSTPTNSSTQYTGVITINETTTLKAIAYIGTCTSGVTTATYTMDLPTYTVTCATGLTGGSIAASPTSAVEGTTITVTATPESGYFIGTITATDGNSNDVPVTVNGNEGTFTMPASNVTVTATFTQGFHVTLVQTANGTISADQTTNLQPGDHVTLTATPDNGCVFLAWYAFKTGNPRDVVSVISNTTILMPASDVTVQAIFVTEEEHEAQLGSGTTSNTNIPTNVRAYYSLTQQIYTASELENQKGTVTKIAFRAITREATRNLTIYMSHTEKSSFSNNYDWEQMASTSKVFEGNVEFGISDWTTIELTTPFEYDGEKNINICVVDNSNSTIGTNNNHTEFYVYTTNTDYRALYATGNSSYANTVGYNAVQNVYGRRLTNVNRINITMLVPGNAEALTISPDAISDFSYVKGQGPSQTHKLDIVGVDLQNDITIYAPTNFEISLTEDGTYTSSLTIPRETGSKGNRNVTTWGFEGTMDEWTAHDMDEDGYNWVLGSTCQGVYLDEQNINEGHNNSSDLLVSGSWTDAEGRALTPDNWLISPQVELGGTFSIWAKPHNPTYYLEHFGIYVSTSGTDPEDFTMLNDWNLTTTWKQYTVDLSLFAGQIGYIAVRHFDCTDQFLILIDDFELNTEAAITVEMPVTITPATVFVRMKDNLNAGTYSGTLTASAGTGDNLNGSVSLSGEVIAAYNITLTANPTEGGTVQGAGQYVSNASVLVKARANSPYQFINWTENGTVVSTDADYTFTVNGDRDLVANFGFIKHIDNWNTAGYYLISSPIATDVNPTNPENVTNMLTPKNGNANTYDLYGFDQSKELEWRNYRSNDDDGHFNLEVGKGYLYGNNSNSNGVDLVFTGTAYSGNGVVTLSKTETTAGDGLDFPDWNLVGNPFPVTAYITKPYYTMNKYGTEIIGITGNSVEPMEGIFVVANINEEPMTFSTEAPAKRGSNLTLNLTDGGSLIDRAIVSFSESEQLPKFQLNRNSTKLYIPQDGKDYAVVCSEEMGAMPVNFKAEDNGTYTLNFSCENVGFAYLHLIDNKTGNDVDLLQTPSYSFEAKTTDYESRFKLVFATGDNSNDDNFAFFSNGSFVINNDGTAELQVIDLMGRILSSETINGCTNVNVNAAPGVYMLRLINGTDVKVQKVVVK